MVDTIAAHWAQELPSMEGRMFALLCQAEGCGWGGEHDYIDHAAHVARELVKAGYGNVMHAQVVALRTAAEDAYGRTDLGKGGPSGTSVATFLRTRARGLEVTA